MSPGEECHKGNWGVVRWPGVARGREVLLHGGMVWACFSEAWGKWGSPVNPRRDEPAQGAVRVSRDRTQCVCRRALRPMWPGQNEGEGWRHWESSWRVSLGTIMALASPQRESISYTSFSVLAYNPSHLLWNSQHLSSSFPLALFPPGCHHLLYRPWWCHQARSPLLPLPLAHGVHIIPQLSSSHHDSAKQLHTILCMSLMVKPISAQPTHCTDFPLFLNQGSFPLSKRMPLWPLSLLLLLMLFPTLDGFPFVSSCPRLHFLSPFSHSPISQSSASFPSLMRFIESLTPYCPLLGESV